MLVEHHAINTQGRDFVVGDIHGCFDLLVDELALVAFDKAVDRLFSVGDLVDRGPSSADCLSWIAQPWFHAVMGNHEAMALQYFADSSPSVSDWYIANGGEWFTLLPSTLQRAVCEVFATLPLAIEVETPTGKVGIVHAEVPHNDWNKLHMADRWRPEEERVLLWSRDRIGMMDETPIAGIDLVYVGHTPMKQVVQLGNVRYIDTAAVYPGGHLTLEQL